MIPTQQTEMKLEQMLQGYINTNTISIRLFHEAFSVKQFNGQTVLVPNPPKPTPSTYPILYQHYFWTEDGPPRDFGAPNVSVMTPDAVEALVKQFRSQGKNVMVVPFGEVQSKTTPLEYRIYVVE